MYSDTYREGNTPLVIEIGDANWSGSYVSEFIYDEMGEDMNTFLAKATSVLSTNLSESLVTGYVMLTNILKLWKFITTYLMTTDVQEQLYDFITGCEAWIVKGKPNVED
jgi:hypothetical protein